MLVMKTCCRTDWVEYLSPRSYACSLR